MRDIKRWNLLRSCEVKIIFLESWYYGRPAKPRGKLRSLLLCFQRTQVQKNLNKLCEMREKEMLLQRPSLTLPWAHVHAHTHTLWVYSSFACRHTCTPINTHTDTHPIYPTYLSVPTIFCWPRGSEIILYVVHLKKEKNWFKSLNIFTL